MADYYSILKKTIASLPESNGAARRSVYSRARNAIVNQLKAYEPPLSPSEITSEQLRLEEAIRKVEAEAARESLGLGTPKAKEEEAPAPETAPAQPTEAQGPAETATPAADQPQEPAPVVEEPAAAAPEQPVPSPLKETLSEASSLGTAANKAVQSAKDAVEPAPETSPVDASAPRQEPGFEDAGQPVEGGSEAAASQAQSADPALFADEPASAESETDKRKFGTGKRSRPSAADALRGSSSGVKILPIAIAAALVFVIVGVAAYFLLPSGEDVADNQTGTPAGQQSASTVQPTGTAPEAPTEQATAGSESSKNTDRLLDDGSEDVVAPDARTVETTTITPPASVPEPSQPSIVTNVESQPAPAAPEAVSPDITQPVTGADAPPPLPGDTLAAVSPEETTPTQPSTSSESGTQRSILYEEGEDAAGAGTAAQGAVVWNVEDETNLDGQSQKVLSAQVDIPERDIKVDIRIKPNDDTSLPASHLVEIKYEFPENFASGDVVNIPGLVMKPTEEARGDALIGASVKVSPGFFWIALSSLPNEQQRNMNLLRERGWIDIPMLYENGKRGILTLEKGSAGASAVESAVTAWQPG
ncbi:MAG: hypothetical protein JJ979_02940 [Roseibium sp.]|nr:hypothetical protein [Roseibium sp.]